MRGLTVLVVFLLALSFLNEIPLAVHALCPGSCTNTSTGVNGARSFGSSNSYTVSGLNVGDFMVTVSTCNAGDSVTSMSGTADSGWTKDSQLTLSGTGTDFPLITSIWHSKSTGTSDAISINYQASAAQGCGEYTSGFDTLATIYAGAFSAGNLVYTCTPPGGAGTHCGDNSQTYSNTVSALGTSMLVVNSNFVNSSNYALFSSCSGVCAGVNGLTNFGASSAQFSHWSNCSPIINQMGQDCFGSLEWAWQGSLTNYAGGFTMNLGTASAGLVCATTHCFVNELLVTAVYSNQVQSGQISISSCTFSQLQCWWYPLLFMGLYSGFILMIAQWLRTSPRGKSHLFLSAVTFGSLVAVIFGIMNIAFPLMMLVLNTIIALRLRA